MILAVTNLLIRLFGLNFDTALKYARIAFFALVGLVVLSIGIFVFKACNRPAKLNEKQIQKVQQAIDKQERSEMVETLAQIEAEQNTIDANVANAENAKLKAIEDARKRAREMTNEELQEALNNLVP